VRRFCEFAEESVTRVSTGKSANATTAKNSVQPEKIQNDERAEPNNEEKSENAGRVCRATPGNSKMEENTPFNSEES
jgi:hypothetical protein